LRQIFRSVAANGRTLSRKRTENPPSRGFSAVDHRKVRQAASTLHHIVGFGRLCRFEVEIMSQILVPVSFGELLDKIAILQIKSERMHDPAKLANVRRELDALQAVWVAHAASTADIAGLCAALKAVNERLWDIEDAIREQERGQCFEAQFIGLARAVYVENDERARIKREINRVLGSALVEEKSYADYRATAAS